MITITVEISEKEDEDRPMLHRFVCRTRGRSSEDGATGPEVEFAEKMQMGIAELIQKTVTDMHGVNKVTKPLTMITRVKEKEN